MIDLASISAKPTVLPTTSSLNPQDRWDHFLARLGVRRGEHRTSPGLYALNAPGPEAAVFVTANYRLSFDALRSALGDLPAYLLVLDTKGINVWCAAGKGTFGTDEIVHRIFSSGLKSVVSHRRLILPQLGAPGVAAHVVKKQTGFTVEYGPVRAVDLPEYLKKHRATAAMRQVSFTLPERAVLIPVELKAILLPMLAAVVVFYFAGGWLSAMAAVSALMAGAALFPILLPWLPGRNFSSKGYILGAVLAVPFAVGAFTLHPGWAWWREMMQALEFLLAMPAVTAFLALNFTGATPFTSRSGVRNEMSAYIPAMAWSFGLGILLGLALVFIH